MKAGRLSEHSLAGVLHLIASFEEAAMLLEHPPRVPRAQEAPKVHGGWGLKATSQLDQ